MTDAHAQSAAEREVAVFRRRNRQFAVAATIVLIAVGGFVVLTLAVVVLQGHAMRTETLQKVALAWCPALFYLWALWTLRGMFAALARGGMTFQPVVVRALARIGWALLLGAGAGLVVAPPVQMLTVPRPVAGFAVFNVPALTLGVVGLALIAMGRMLQRGARLEAETASLKAILEDFI
jgi:hypothetical protein